MCCSEPDVVLYKHLSLGERQRIYVDTSQFSSNDRVKTRRPKFPPKKLLHIIFKCVYHQRRVCGSGIINAVTSPHLHLSFLLSSSSPIPFISGGLAPLKGGPLCNMRSFKDTSRWRLRTFDNAFFGGVLFLSGWSS